jgi:hypothetical protein
MRTIEHSVLNEQGKYKRSAKPGPVFTGQFAHHDMAEVIAAIRVGTDISQAAEAAQAKAAETVTKDTVNYNARLCRACGGVLEDETADAHPRCEKMA